MARGQPFFWLLFFGCSKKSNTPSRAEDQQRKLNHALQAQAKGKPNRLSVLCIPTRSVRNEQKMEDLFVPKPIRLGESNKLTKPIRLGDFRTFFL